MRNPHMFISLKRDIYFLEGMVFRYSTASNKIFQESKKIGDHIYLSSNSDCSFMVILLSMDIFRNGIRIYINDSYETLFPAGNQAVAHSLEHLRIDIKTVDFCI